MSREIPLAPQHLPILGHIAPMLTGPPWDITEQWLRTHGPTLRFKIPGAEYIVSSDTEVVRQVLLTNADNYVKDIRSMAPFLDLLGQGLLSSDGPLWKRQRATLAKAFRIDALRNVAAVTRRAVDRSSVTLDEHARSGKPVDIGALFRRLTLQVIAEATLSMSPEESDEVLPRLYEPLVAEANRRVVFVVEGVGQNAVAAVPTTLANMNAPQVIPAAPPRLVDEGRVALGPVPLPDVDQASHHRILGLGALVEIAGVEPAAHIVGVDAADRHHGHVRRDDGELRFHHRRARPVGGEQLEPGRAGADCRERFARGEKARRGHQVRRRARCNHLEVGIGRDDDPPAGQLDIAHLRGLEHGPGADQHLVAELAGERFDALERLRRIERNLDDPDAALVNRVADRFGLGVALCRHEQRAEQLVGAHAESNGPPGPGHVS